MLRYICFACAMLCTCAQTTTSAPGAADSTTGAPDEAATEGDAFNIRESKTARHAHGVEASKIKPTKTEAALRLFVVDKKKGPIEGIVILLLAPDGESYFTDETDAKGYAEVLVPVGQTYDVIYLSLGRREISAKVTVDDKPNYNLKLTLRYSRKGGRAPEVDGASQPRFVLDGVQFETAKARLKTDSYARLDKVVEYMTHKKSARIEISGHTDNVGSSKSNQKLSERRAEACRDYVVSKGIDSSRIVTIGYGDTRPVDTNDTAEGRQKNRRIEAVELVQ